MVHQTQNVLITGASSGIGKLTALTVARAGHHVYASMRELHGRNRQAAADMLEIGQREGLKIEVVELDVTVPESVSAAIARLTSTNTDIDVLVNNAGHMSIGIAEAFTEEQTHQQFEVNFFGPVRVSRAVLPRMRERGAGLIVHVSSIVGRLLFPACAFYCASKFALEAYAEVLHYELTGLGIDSVLVEPGPFATQLLSNSPGPWMRTVRAGMANSRPCVNSSSGILKTSLHPIRPRIRKRMRCHFETHLNAVRSTPIAKGLRPRLRRYATESPERSYPGAGSSRHWDGDARLQGSSGN